jgi:hypothetical protein
MAKVRVLPVPERVTVVDGLSLLATEIEANSKLGDGAMDSVMVVPAGALFGLVVTVPLTVPETLTA